jgi:HD-GYP domain-containing protein (c-di-GMP phosphodiesterase class II)
MPKVGLGIYGKVIAIVDTYDALTSKRPFREAYGPEIALALMSSEIKYKFDPVLLRVFMKVMAIQPIKILDKANSRLRVG